MESCYKNYNFIFLNVVLKYPPGIPFDKEIGFLSIKVIPHD